MASILCIHGIAQELKGRESIKQQWLPYLRDGMDRAGARDADLPDDADVDVAFYGDCFRKTPTQPVTKSAAEASYRLVDIADGLESDLVRAWASAAGVDGESGEQTKSAWSPATVQRLAELLLGNPYFSALTKPLFVGALKQVRFYFEDEAKRAEVRKRLADRITADTRLVIAHSLGSVVAYEVLCREAAIPRVGLITLGSPLGLPNLVFDRLDPAPADGVGAWPRQVHRWWNVSAVQDLVAAVKDLNPLFAGDVRDIRVDNQALAHDVAPYLTARATGAAVIEALNAG